MSSHMKALVFDGTLSVREVARPRPTPGEALIEITYAGICGTDRQILKGYSGFRGIPGHEFVGRVVECADDTWVGKRVVGEITSPAASATGAGAGWVGTALVAR